MNENDVFRFDDGPYVLGALDEADRLAFEAHLLTCAECRERVAELRPTADLLGGITAADLEDVAPVPETMLPGLLARARRERRRRRAGTVSLGAVAAAAAAALVVVAWPASKPSAPVAEAFAPVRPSPVSATAALVARHWGTEIDLHCHYAEESERSVPYQLVVTDRGHHSFIAGTWTLAPGNDTDFTGGTAVPRADIELVQITLPDGTPILQLTP
jgi:anti-sigma factor RsiW